MTDKKLPVRILHVVSAMDRGGAETLIMNIYRNIDREKVQFDFISHSAGTDEFEKEIEMLGGKIYYILSLGHSGPLLYVKNVMKVMNINQYAAVHIHTDFQGGFPALAAKLSGIEHRICHSHSNHWMKNSAAAVAVLPVLRLMIKSFSTQICSCSHDAAVFLFGKRAVDKEKVQIIKNGIDLEPYLTSYGKKLSLHEEFKLDKSVKIIGHIGRFSKYKNQIYILSILKKLREKDQAFAAVFVGDGPLKVIVEQEAEKLGLQDYVRFLGVREDVPRLMRGFDIFVFPSLFEGFGIVMLEAQCSGVPCVASSQVPIETDMGLGLAEYIDLDDGVEAWSEAVQKKIQNERPSKIDIEKRLTKKGFHVKASIQKWMNLYGLKSYQKINSEEWANEAKSVDHIV
ncbi:glycosyltransferase family 1 protein [Siminovitchia sediminis]|uniref:Glycosyltransferase family 1 protein n=1 Tax=Siminovitchia sediminis TaxID=1274353 RepID=A0ABW4KP26_9BACI